MIDHAQAIAVQLREIAVRAEMQPEYALAGGVCGGAWMDIRGCVMQYAWSGPKYPRPRFPTWTGFASRPATSIVSRVGTTFADGVWWLALEKIGQGGASDGIQRVTIRPAVFDAGVNVGPLPNTPVLQPVRQGSTGRFRLTWIFSPAEEQEATAEFKVFDDAGTGVIDFGAAVGTVVYEAGRCVYTWESDPFSDGDARKYAVLAVSTSGVYGLTATAGSDPSGIYEQYYAAASPPATRLAGAVIVASEPTAPPPPEFA